MKKTLIYYKLEYADLAMKLCDNYRAHDHEEADIVSEEEHDDIEYAVNMQYDEAVFISVPYETKNTDYLRQLK